MDGHKLQRWKTMRIKIAEKIEGQFRQSEKLDGLKMYVNQVSIARIIFSIEESLGSSSGSTEYLT